VAGAPEATRDEQPLGADGRFHVTDEPIDLSSYSREDWVTLAVFWALAAVVFCQVFTRYVLSEPAGSTEQIARGLLVAVVCMGVSMAGRRNRHILGDCFYRLMPRPTSRAPVRSRWMRCAWRSSAIAPCSPGRSLSASAASAWRSSTAIDGQETIAAAGGRCFRLMLETASGRRTGSEELGDGEDEFAPWVLGATV
jgi:TRAP-type C4-dicarboxylate transport system permease small subunit